MLKLYQNKLKPKGMVKQSSKLQFQSISHTEKFDALKRYKSTGDDRRTATYALRDSLSSDTHQVVEIIKRDLCYVAVCNNYAICNKLQTALNCNAVCNTSYFKLRCDDNAICNVLQIASKFYHLKILKMRKKKLINGKMHRFNHILLWIQSDTNLFELGMQKSQSTLQLLRKLFCPRTFVKTHLSVRLLLCLSVPLSVAKTLT